MTLISGEEHKADLKEILRKKAYVKTNDDPKFCD